MSHCIKDRVLGKCRLQDSKGAKCLKWRHIILIVALGAILGVGVFLYLTRPVKIAFVGELSTSGSALSVESREAFLYLVDQYNQNGGINGRRIVPYIFDDKKDNSGKIKLDNDLKKAGIELVVGFNVSSMVPTINYLLETNRYLIVSPTVTTDEMTGKDDLFIKISPPNAKQVMALYPAVKKESVEKMFIIYDGKNIQYTKTLQEEMTRLLKADGKAVVSTYKVEETIDFSAIEDVLTGQQPDGIFLAMNGMDTAQIVQYCRIKGYTGDFFTGTWATTTDFIENAGAYGNGVYTCEVKSKLPDQKLYDTFEGAIKMMSGSEVNFSHTRAYNATKIVLEAVKQTKSTNPLTIKEALIKQRTFKGIETNFELDANGDTTGDYQLLIVENGKFVEVK